jgi:hypothetical protein
MVYWGKGRGGGEEDFNSSKFMGKSKLIGLKLNFFSNLTLLNK